MFNTYSEVAQKLAATLPELRWIDLDKGQLDDPERFNSIIVPGVLIRIPEIEWEYATKREQRGKGTIVVSTVIRLPEQTHHSVPLLLENLKAMELADRVHDVVASIPGISQRSKSQAYPSFSFFVIEQHFTASFISQASPLKEVTVPLQINQSIHRPATA